MDRKMIRGANGQSLYLEVIEGDGWVRVICKHPKKWWIGFSRLVGFSDAGKAAAFAARVRMCVSQEEIEALETG